MAKYSASQTTWTPTAVADTTAFTDSGYQAIQGGGASQLLKIMEIYMGGQAGASSPSIMVVARDSTVGATLTSGLLAALDATTTAPGTLPTNFKVSTTKPQRSSTLYLLNLAFNAFGGIVRWVAAPFEEITTYGASASLGEVSLSAFTGGTPGLMGSHFILEIQ